MESYLGLRLQLILKNGSSAQGTVHSIDDSAQKLSLTDVKLIPKGGKDSVSFPELTILSKDISDVEIISSKSVEKKKNSNPITNSPSPSPSYSPHATPSVYANKTHTFPVGNARQSLPREEFDFVANLARFDKANEFKKIQSEDSVPKGDRLVAVNSPQRKLGINESVLEEGANVIIKKKAEPSNVTVTVTSKLSPPAITSSVAVVDQFEQLAFHEKGGLPNTNNTNTTKAVKAVDNTANTTKAVNKITNRISSPILVEGSSSDSESETDCKPGADLILPMVSSKLFDSATCKVAGDLEYYRTVASINFAHHLLAQLDPKKTVVLLLGVGESSAILMETFFHLSCHSRRSGETLAIFAAGGKGSDGKRIELCAAVKNSRKKLLAGQKVKFTTALNEIVKLSDVIVFDALGHDGEMTQNAVKGLTEWMKKLLINPVKDDRVIIYGIESSILRKCPSFSANQNVSLVTFGMARDTLVPSLKVSKSILYVDSGITERTFKDEMQFNSSGEIYSESFVTEIEY